MESLTDQAAHPEAGRTTSTERNPDAKKKVARGARYEFDGEMRTAAEVAALFPQFNADWIRNALKDGDKCKADLIARRHRNDRVAAASTKISSKRSAWRDSTIKRSTK